jgi:recombination protein RecR
MPEEIKNLIEYFSEIPTLGPRQAARLVFYLSDIPKDEFKKISGAFSKLSNIDKCERCFFFKKKNEKLCSICSNSSRSPYTIAIVEKTTDLLTIEKMKKFNGHYLILGKLAEKGVLDEETKKRIQKLKERIIKELNGKAEEIIIALSPTSIGDFTAQIIKEEFKNLASKITRLGRGLPSGADLEFTDETTLLFSFENRN